jgi:polar amino acid transport system substrate-binding protein
MKIVLSLFLLPVIAVADQAQQSLKWGADPSGGAPYVYLDPTNINKYIGFETEFMEALAEKMGYKPELVPYSWDTLVPALQRGEYDLIVNGFEATTDREEHILMSDPYYLFQLQVTVRKENNTIKSLADCKGHGCTVGALANSAAVRILKSQKINTKEYADPASPYQDLMTGRIDAVLADLPITMAYAAPNPRFKPAGDPQYRGAYVIGVRKGDEELLEKTNKAIKVLIQDGTLQKILTKWQLWDGLQPELEQGSSVILLGEIPADQFDWHGAIMRLSAGAGITALIGIGSMIIALLLGVPLAVILLRAPPWGRFFIGIFVEFFRGTPILVQLFFLYFGLPAIGITIPGWVTALVGLGLNYAAYESQVFRNAFESIPKGQWEAAASLGMSPFQIFKKIILPQGLRFALPPMTNDFVSLFKDTSVVFAISVWELATAYRELANSSQQYFLLSLVTCLYYLAMSVPLSRYARHLERSLKRQNKKKPARLILAESST